MGILDLSNLGKTDKNDVIINELCKAHETLVETINTLINNQNALMQELTELKEKCNKCSKDKCCKRPCKKESK